VYRNEAKPVWQDFNAAIKSIVCSSGPSAISAAEYASGVSQTLHWEPVLPPSAAPAAVSGADGLFETPVNDLTEWIGVWAGSPQFFDGHAAHLSCRLAPVTPWTAPALPTESPTALHHTLSMTLTTKLSE
jgi:hypothetical protein